MAGRKRSTIKNCVNGTLGCNKVEIIEEFNGYDEVGEEIWEVVEVRGGELQSSLFGAKFPVCARCLSTLKRGPKHSIGFGF